MTRGLILTIFISAIVAAVLIFSIWSSFFRSEAPAASGEEGSILSPGTFPSGSAGESETPPGLRDIADDFRNIFGKLLSIGAPISVEPDASPREELLILWSPERTAEVFTENPPAELTPVLWNIKTVSSSTSSLSAAELRQKYFKVLNPPSYLSYLNQAQDFLVEEGTLNSSEKVSFQNEDEVFSLLQKLNSYLCSLLADPENFYSQQDYLDARNNSYCDDASFLSSVETLKAFQNTEAELLEKGILPSGRQGSFLWGIFRMIENFFAPAALAQLGNALGGAVCYQEAGLNPIVGMQVITPCCDCGNEIIRRGRILHVEHCSFFSTGRCNFTNLGCLNGPGFGGNAIWDPMTGICGFDSLLGAGGVWI